MISRLLRAKQLLSIIAAIVLIQSCQKPYRVEKKECGEMTFSKIINLQVDSLLHSQIREFFPIGDNSYILTDGARVYKTDSTGAVVKVINNQGHGKGEYLKICNLFSNGHNIYTWCGMSCQLYKYDMELNYIDKYDGLHHAIQKFVVTDNDTAYFLLAGGFDETIGILPLKKNSVSSYSGCYNNEDNALLINFNSGGITLFNNQIRYVKPSEMEVWTVGKDKTWLFDDDEYYVAPVAGQLNTRTDEEILNYILQNSTCSGLFADGNFLWLITETGIIQQDKEGTLTYDKRYLNLCKISKSGELISSCKYHYPVNAINYIIYQNRLHLLFIEGESYKIKQCML